VREGIYIIIKSLILRKSLITRKLDELSNAICEFQDILNRLIVGPGYDTTSLARPGAKTGS